MDFVRPVFNVSRVASTDPAAIHTLTDLIDFNAQSNPHHVFAMQEVCQNGKHIELVSVTFQKLKQAAMSWAHRIQGSLPCLSSSTSRRPVALFLESDINLFIHLAGSMLMHSPVLVLSIRLSPTAISHLIKSTSARAVVVSSRTEPIVAQALGELPIKCRTELQILHSVPFLELLNAESANGGLTIEKKPSCDTETAVILHSSGTTGLPKPIRLAHRYLLGYAACHRLLSDQCIGRPNVSTLPMYHGLGLLSPCISLATGKPSCFPSASLIPSSLSIPMLIEQAQAKSLITVPSILEEVKTDPRFLQSMAGLDFVAVGGGAIKSSLGDLLISARVNLLNHYGATEIGAIAPIFVPEEDYDWHYLRIRTDMGLEINEVGQDDNGSVLCQLTGYPFGWGCPFVIRDMLRLRPGSKHIEVAIVGRNDDLLVLSTGEKVLPNRLEATISEQNGIKSALMFGQDREEVGLLIEPESSLHNEAVEDLAENMKLDRHARVASRNMILVIPCNKSLPRSDKGSVMRQEAYGLLADEINLAYVPDNVLAHSLPPLETELEQLLSGLRKLVEKCLEDRQLSVKDWSNSVDWFEMGMDSLEATRLARCLNAIPNKKVFLPLTSNPVLPAFIYRNPSFDALSRALLSSTKRSATADSKQMLDLVSRYAVNVTGGQIVMLTGARGHLGAHLLKCLVGNSGVSRVICVSRSYQGKDLRKRQEESNGAHGIHLSDQAWTKVQFLSSDHLDQPFLGLRREEYEALRGAVTHIIHNAWPMDFQRTLESLEPQVQAVQRLVELAVDSHRQQGASTLPRLLFTSSIAVGSQYAGGRILPEAPIADPLSTADIGYARAKWVCEQILTEAVRTSPHPSFLPMIVRLGQLSGSTIAGSWNPHEHVPLMLRVSQLVGALPVLDGVSHVPL
ncbi:acetyl-CoA synthetase-like protein [Aspergillus sclerotioniger CBS 115572]|uniref:Acetyl-CoA synthetase-like protein n=1 Tax=Aspergillus sclerotioniger CBS 115572 TaxID=1450535 RepID=A0A317X3R6_9EURO|nr:acetyl-CoA synthetase-like protein [Aspergillus sclerotioniger CBS 115572]PWY93213.1 acetyl-CoA synthetase-like protein [Aspergillus sclerotioniger CBS 115572]